MTEVKTEAAPKAKRVRKAKEAPAATKTVATPSVELYGFRSGWTGPSDVTNKNLSRTAVDPSRFNAYPDGNVTERDQKAMEALRSQFGGKSFERRNCDAGILRRLMERGLAEHVSGDPKARDSQFRLTSAGQGKPAKAKKAA